jgi:hypothetical protein
MRISHSRDHFVRAVRGALGEEAVTESGRKVTLAIRKISHQDLEQARRLVEGCSSKPSRLDNACTAVCNIAAVLDVAGVPLQASAGPCGNFLR